MFKRWFLPGFLFQSVLIGGGYATGRELVEFFLTFGPLNGLLGILLTTAMFSLVAMVFFEFARITRSRTYAEFFRHLLGRAWFLYEAGYLVLGILVLSVVSAAAGEIAKSSLGVNNAIGTIILGLFVVFMVFLGTGFIERALAGWSFLLYAVFAVFIGLFLEVKGFRLVENLVAVSGAPGWPLGALKYVGYSIVVLPVIVFVTEHFKSRSDALIAGSMAGLIAMAPALLFYLAMAADYEAVLDAPVPSEYMIRILNIGWLSILFYITIFGTFVETGTAFIHGFNQRIAESWERRGRHFQRSHRALVAIACLVISVVLAESFGLVDLIAKGYGTLTWYFIVIFLLPLLTRGIWKIYSAGYK